MMNARRHSTYAETAGDKDKLEREGESGEDGVVSYRLRLADVGRGTGGAGMEEMVKHMVGAGTEAAATVGVRMAVLAPPAWLTQALSSMRC